MKWQDPRESSRRRFRDALAAPHTLDEAEGGEALHRPRVRTRQVAELGVVLRRLLRGHVLELALIVVALSISTALRVAYPASPKFAVDYVLTDRPGPSGIPAWLGLPSDRVTLLMLLAGSILILEVIALTLDVAGRYRFRLLNWGVQIRFSRRVYERALHLPLWKLHGIQSGGMTSLLREDARAPSDILFQLVMSMWRPSLQLIGALSVLASVDLLLLLAAVVLLGMVWLTHRRLIGNMRPLYRNVRRTRQGVDADIAEAVAGVRTLRAFGRERLVVRRFVTGTHIMVRHIMRVWWRSTYVEVAWRVAMALASVAVLVYGGSRVLTGELTLGDLLMFLGYVALLLRPLESLVSGAMRLQDDLAGFSRTLDILEEEPELSGATLSKRAPAADVRPEIRFENVGYTYPDGAEPLLDGLTFELHPGETVALVGVRGAGKTTTVNLLARFFDPVHGRILLDGTDIRDFAVPSYRRLIGLVEQDVVLFDGTVLENIAFGDRHATRAELEEAADRAGVTDFIARLPQGFATRVGERGVRLSGGQRQAIALARALRMQPKILILDEATNNLDGESEALVLRGIRALGPTCSRLVVSHRLSAICAADRVLLLESGKIIEQGSHSVLLARGGRYADLIKNQVLSSERSSVRAASA
ncbi:MAG TPA: ABC transporter ATP-binding protein [Polyangiaceae bacterium]|nr:ABC transporter ATP-binding protein [Polyangiaceae bacterium]